MCVACFDSRFQAAGIYHGAFHLGMVYPWLYRKISSQVGAMRNPMISPWKIPIHVWKFHSWWWYPNDIPRLYTIKYSITCPWYPHWIPCEIAGGFPLSGHSGSEGQLSPGLQVLELRGLVGGLRSQFSNCLMYLNLVLKKYMTRSNPQCLRGLFYITINNPNCWGVQISSPNRLEGRLCDGLFGSKSRTYCVEICEQHWTSPINYSAWLNVILYSHYNPTSMYIIYGDYIVFILWF